jgi:hypothetical protein
LAPQGIVALHQQGRVGERYNHRKSLIDALRQPVPIFSEPKDLLRVRILLASVAASASGRYRVLGTGYSSEGLWGYF